MLSGGGCDAPPACRNLRLLVVGDVNSTLACAIVAKKAGIPVAHVEAGLRSGDRAMPEEINRLVTDQIADLLWIPSMDAEAHLLREGIPASRIQFVGNIMIDSFEMLRERIEADTTRASLGLVTGEYAVVTLHRPSNVDTREALEPLVGQLLQVSRELPLLFTVHPRTRKKLEEFGLLARLEGPSIRLTEPLGYIQFMNLVRTAKAVITDSGDQDAIWTIRRTGIARALRTSRVGVAMIVRSAFLEGQARHKALFSIRPPAAVLQFTERVVMHKGKLAPKGSTATAYCWLVWRAVPQNHPTELHWIAPCRKALERKEDYL
jgi:hypothetical protein